MLTSIQRWAQTNALPQPAELDGYSSENTSRAQTPLNTPEGSTTKLGPELESDTPKRAVYRRLKIISENSLDSALSDASKASDGKEEEEEDDEEEDESSHAQFPESIEEKAEALGDVQTPTQETIEPVGGLKEETQEESASNQSTPLEAQQEETTKLEETEKTEENKEVALTEKAIDGCDAVEIPEIPIEKDVERMEEQTVQTDEENAKTEEEPEVQMTQSDLAEVAEAPSLAEHEAGQAENTEAENIQEQLEDPSDCVTDAPPSSEAPEASWEAPKASCDAPETGSEAQEASLQASEASSEAPEASLQAPETSSEAPEASLQAPVASSEAPEASLQAPEVGSEALDAGSEAPDASTATESTVAPLEPSLVGTPSQDEEEGPSDVESERSQEPQLSIVDISGMAARLLDSWKDLKARWSKNLSCLYY